MAGPAEDWFALLDRLEGGDALAFATFSRLVSGFLIQLRAYDFEDDWDDLRQDVLMSVVSNARAGRLRDTQAFVGYVKVITRNKFVDRLKRRLRHHEKDALPWDDEAARAVAADPNPEQRAGNSALWREVELLPEDQQRIVTAVYREGKTYGEASRDIGMPLGTLKRKLTASLRALRGQLTEAADDA
jgi:RNA polymerase sigma-70 factor (ECF subfamily)